MRKQLTCPGCGDVVADAVYRLWPGNLIITSTEGYQIQPLRGAIELRLAQQGIASASGKDRAEARARLDFVTRNISELIYDFPCRRGHSTLRTAPQITQAMQQTPGAWVSLA